MALSSPAVPHGYSIHLPRIGSVYHFYHLFLVLQLIFRLSLSFIAADNVIDSQKSLADVIVHEGDKARFLCYTSHVPQSQVAPLNNPTSNNNPRNNRYNNDNNNDNNNHYHHLSHENNSSNNKKNSSDDQRSSNQPTVSWTLNNHPLYLDDPLTTKQQLPRVKSTIYDDRHVLEIAYVRPDDAGLYACTVTSPSGQEKTFQGTLSVQSPPDPPMKVAVTSCHGNAASISWRPGNNNGAEITEFSIQFNISDKPDTWFDFYEDFPGEKNQAFVELSPYGTYSFRVRATNKVGISRPSNVTPRMCTTPPDRPDRNPSLVWTLTDKKGLLVVKWEPLNRLSFHGPGFHYIVLWRLKGSLAWNSARVLGSHTTTYEQEVDQVYALFELQVKATNEMGQAHQPAFIYLGRSFEAEPEISVSNLRVDPEKTLTSDTAHLIWEAVDPTDSKIMGKFRGYKIMYWTWFGGKDKKYKVSVFIPSHGLTTGEDVKATVSGLPAHSTIRFQVVVVNAHYQGPPSDVIDVFTPEGVPSAVRGLFAESVTPHSVLLMWLPPKDANGVLTGFDVGLHQVMGNKLGPLKVFQGRDPYLLRRRIVGLKANTRYRIHLVAKTKTGRGEMSFIDVQTAVKKRAGKKKSRQTDSYGPGGQMVSGSRKESSYTNRMLPNDDDSANSSSANGRHFMVSSSFLLPSLIVVSTTLSTFLTISFCCSSTNYL